MIGSKRVSRCLNRLAFRSFGIVLATFLAYGTSLTGFNFLINGSIELVKAEIARLEKYQGRPAPYSDRPIKMRARTSSVGRTPYYRGGIKNQADIAELMRAEQARFERFAVRHQELLQASTSPVPQMPPQPPPVGEPEEGEGLGGSGTGVGFQDRHEDDVPDSDDFNTDPLAGFGGGSGGGFGGGTRRGPEGGGSNWPL